MKSIMKNKITIALIAIVFVMMLGLMGKKTHAHASAIGIDAKVVSRATIEENFTDNAVIVVLNGQATRSFRKYTVEDFAEINAVAVTNLSERTSDLSKKQIAAERTGDRRAIQQYIDNNMLVNTDTFRTILMIQLAERDKENVLRAIRILEQRDDIVSAEPNYIQSIQSMEAAHPNDANLRYQWVRDNTRTVANIQLEDAWDWSTGSETVLVGVIDTGIDGGHPDLTNRLQRNLCADFSTQNLGTLWGLLPSTIMTPNPIDNGGHGTRVAGIIGAQGVNNGVAGVNQNVRLVSLRVFNNNGDTTTQILNCAIDYAQGNNIPIVNYSIGGFSAANSTRTAISNYSGFFVCSTGNTGGNNDVTHHYPSYYANRPGDALQNMIAVGRSDNADERPADSNYGATTVNIFAPGQDILSTSPGGYISRSGSSYATPHVTGVAALMKAMRPSMTPSQMRTALIDSTETITINIPDGSGGTTTQNVRRLNALRSLQSVAFTTSISGSHCTITGVASGITLPVNLTIPEKLNDRTVTQIGNSAFANQTQISTITIPASVTSIGSNSFENCTNLTSITLPNNLISIGTSAFKRCTSLSSITIPNSVTNIDSSAFENCSYLQNITLSDYLTCIGGSAFKGCASLGSITIPNSVTNIDSSAFENCTSLTSVALSNNLKDIGDYAFRYCSELKDLIIPNSVVYIGQGTFSGCSSITNITIPDSVVIIYPYAFENCTNLKKVVVQREIDELTMLGVNAFEGCNSLERITVPISRVFDYKNYTMWPFYSSIICCYNYHHYTYSLDPNNDNQHNGICDCGHILISNHYYDSLGICVNCGYEHPHAFTYQSHVSEDGSFYHNKYCYGCRYSIDEHHTFVNGICECGFHENTVETVWQEGAVISSGSSITLLKARTDYQLIKLYTVDFGEIYVNVRFTTTILLLGEEVYGVPFEQLRIDLFENGMVLYFDIVQIEEGYEYPYPHVWHDYPFYLNKVEFIG